MGHSIKCVKYRKTRHSFSDVQELFEGEKLVVPDTRKDYGESRMIAIGRINGRLVIGVFTQRSNIVRIISVRKANERQI